MNVLMLWENRSSLYSGVELAGLNILRHLTKRHTIRLIYLVKTRVLEAMAMGKPVVTTSAGMRGITATAGQHLHVGDSPEAFVDRVQEPLEDETSRRKMGHQAREFVKQHHSWKRVAEDIA